MSMEYLKSTSYLFRCNHCILGFDAPLNNFQLFLYGDLSVNDNWAQNYNAKNNVSNLLKSK